MRVARTDQALIIGNFGFAILIVTLIIKILFLPLANKSYASMAKMKAVQPEMVAIREQTLHSWSCYRRLRQSA